MANDYNITGNTSKTLTEIWWRWDSPSSQAHFTDGCVELRFLVKNPYDNPGKLYSLEFSLDGGTTRYPATVLPDKGVGATAFDLNAKIKQISVWWFAGYDLRLMRKFNGVKVYARFCEDLTGDQTEERSAQLDVDLRPTGHFSVITPRSNDRYFNLKFVSKETVIPGVLHFTVEIDKVGTFDSPDLQVLSTRDTPLEWLCDGGAFPEEGVESSSNHIIEFNSSLLGSLTEDEYYYRITADFDQFYPVITYPADGQVFIGETIDVTGHVIIIDN
ncbi:MAG: hypothetical protein U5N56_00040 [Candidatus Marinimicrobia bacterium]|nr:hypothetical protein [Candidatus Neomarinimicrobiota bacterium]MDZ7821572.1 hypothetical protein [Candidatus Neomarinimicrobiota bacterium]